ncbi:MAG: hypothetical protein ACE14W_12545 [Candidatus Velamenicoccus archaeovorus]
MDTSTRPPVFTYSCPVCGIGLERSDFEKEPDEYSCPFCGSRLRPSRAVGRMGWDS